MMKTAHLLALNALCAFVAGTSLFAQTPPPAAEPYVWRSVTIKANGFINGIVYSPAANGPLYMHTDMGGAYRLDRKADRWVCLTDWIRHDDWSLNQLGVETMATDPADPNRVYMAVGTYMGPGAIFRSSDQGATWERTNVDFPMNGNGSARNAGQRMNVDPNFPGRLLYGTRTKGLYTSTDHGATWGNVAGFPVTGDTAKPAKEAGIVWTLFDRASGKPGAATPVAYAGVCTTAEKKLFRSLDGGVNWAAIPGQPGGDLLPTRAAITPDGNCLYLTYVTAKEYPGPWGILGGEVYRVDAPTTDKPTWTRISPASGNFGWSGVAIDPGSPQTVYVSTMNRYGNPGDDIYRSTDGGQSWKPLNVNKHRNDQGVPYLRDAGLHWTGDVQINPHNADEAWLTTGYGLYRARKLSDPEPTWYFDNEGFEQSAVNELLSPPAGSAHLLSAIGDRDGYRHDDFSVSPKHGRFGQTNDAGQVVSRSIGTNEDLDMAWDKPEVLVRVGSNAQVSRDGGTTWDLIREWKTDSGPESGSIAISPDAKTVVWAPRQHEALYSIAEAERWSAWTPCKGLPAGARRVTADLVDPNTFYALTNTVVFRSTDGGKNWAAGKDAVKGMYWLRATPSHAGHLWMTSGDDGAGGLSRSTDGGMTWTRVAPDQVTVAKQVGLGAPKPGADYPAVFIGGTVGGVRGFFRSDDQGSTWVRVNDDQHQYGNVTVINGDPRLFGRLYVGTNGRGIFYAEPDTRPVSSTSR